MLTMLAACSMAHSHAHSAHNRPSKPAAPSSTSGVSNNASYSLLGPRRSERPSLSQREGQTIELRWSRGLDRGAAQREGEGTPAAVEWQPLYPARAPGSNPTSLPEIKHFHGLGRVEVPGLALACRPANTSTLSAPATSVIVAPGGAYKFVSVPGKLEADSVPMSHNTRRIP